MDREKTMYITHVLVTHPSFKCYSIYRDMLCKYDMLDRLNHREPGTIYRLWHVILKYSRVLV